MQKSVILLIITVFFNHSSADLFSSIYKLEILAKLEPRLLTTLETYVNAQPLGVPLEITRFINETKLAIGNTTDFSEYVGHPINVFHMISRFVFDWSYLINKLACKKCTKATSAKDFKNAYRNILRSLGPIPTDKDMNGTMTGVLRLWSIYQLDFNKLMAGDILGVKSNIPFSFKDVLRLANFAQTLPDKYFEEVHLKAQLEQLSRNTALHPASVYELAKVYAKQSFFKPAKNLLESILHLGNPDVMEGYKTCLQWLGVHGIENKTLTRPSPQRPVYEELCRKELKTPKELTNLRCYIRKTRIPIYTVKEEVYNIDPRVSVFHDVISDSEIDLMLSKGLEMMTRAEVVSQSSTAGSKASDYRVANTAWLSDLNSCRLMKITKRIGLITGLTTFVSRRFATVEFFQVANYGIGGMYEPHFDYLNVSLSVKASETTEESIRLSGDRMATWMFYLSDVKAGGATVFPDIKVRIPVVKNAAVFWYNLKRNGEYDERTLHAGCPVLLGSKLVCNKWILEAEQTFKRPCGMSVDSIDS